jgi:2-dehydro-3-deoxygluconokinase
VTAPDDILDVLAVGEAMAVLSPDPPGSLRHARTLAMSAAGAEANVAVHLAALGLRTAFVSRVGDDPFGELLRDRLTSAGVVAALTTDPTAPTGVYFKDPGDTGTRVHYYRAGSAAATMDESVWCDRRPARVVHLSGITPALSATCARLVATALAERPIAGATMSFDVNYRPRLWSVERAAPVLATLANQADLVFVGLDEAATLWGTTTPKQVREVLDRPAMVVVKDGATGATAFGPGGTLGSDHAVFEPALPVEVVERVGAGDAFAAGFLYGTLTGRTVRERLRFGHHLAADALLTVADVGTPRVLAELLEAVIDREDPHEF